MTFTVGELFAGVGGFSKGFEQAGFRTAWQCEIDNDATSVLERHWPDVRRFRDVREIDPADLEPVDVITFGSPCQGFSVAGRGEGLEDARSGLFSEAIRIIRGVRPTFAVWENVPGAYSANDGRDFGAVLAALAELGALDICWRVLDAQHWGVPQRRRRIFLVADFGGERAASVLFESESVHGDSQAGSEERQGAARDAENGAGSGGVANALANSGRRGYSGDRGDGSANLIPTTVPVRCEAARDCLTSRNERIDAESETFVVAPPPISFAGMSMHGWAPASMPHSVDIALPLDATRAATVAAFDERQITSNANRSTVERGGPCSTLNGSVGMSGVGFQESQSGFRSVDQFATLDSNYGSRRHNGVREGMSVRRLTPVECERLMGWPDGHTKYRADGSEIPDGARYRLCGNGVVAPVAFWLAQRVRAALEAV